MRKVIIVAGTMAIIVGIMSALIIIITGTTGTIAIIPATVIITGKAITLPATIEAITAIRITAAEWR